VVPVDPDEAQGAQLLHDLAERADIPQPAGSTEANFRLVALWNNRAVDLKWPFQGGACRDGVSGRSLTKARNLKSPGTSLLLGSVSLSEEPIYLERLGFALRGGRGVRV
jgi:hypothetical protein